MVFISIWHRKSNEAITRKFPVGVFHILASYNLFGSQIFYNYITLSQLENIDRAFYDAPRCLKYYDAKLLHKER